MVMNTSEDLSQSVTLILSQAVNIILFCMQYYFNPLSGCDIPSYVCHVGKMGSTL